MTGRAPRYGRRVQYYGLVPSTMAYACYKLAHDLRNEAAMGWGPVPMTSAGGEGGGRYHNTITRLEAAERMREQGDRWAAEANGGPRNVRDRAAIGEP